MEFLKKKIVNSKLLSRWYKKYATTVNEEIQKEKVIYKSKESDKVSFHKTKTGNYYLPIDAVNDGIRYAMINDEIFDQPIYDVAKQYIKSNTVVLDVGSNFGQMAVLFSKLVGDRGKVYAFEVQKFVYDILCKNIETNQAPVTAVFGAVYNKSGETLYLRDINFEKEEQCYGSYGIDCTKHCGVAVKTVAIDDLNIKEPISFMKLDVQGADLLAMQGAVHTIKKNQMPIVFEYEISAEQFFDTRFQDYVDFMQSINYYFSRVVMPNNFLILPKKTKV